VAENPLRQLSRVAAGIVLMQGRLGHQVLGQLLVMDTSEVAMAGAALALAATSGPRNAVAQVALRTVAPAVAGHIVLKKQEDRIDKKLERLNERKKKMEECEDLQRENDTLKTTIAQLRSTRDAKS